MRKILKSNYKGAFAEFTITTLVMTAGAFLIRYAPGELFMIHNNLNMAAGFEAMSQFELGFSVGMTPVFWGVVIAALTTTVRLIADLTSFAYSAIKMKIENKKNKELTEGGGLGDGTATARTE